MLVERVWAANDYRNFHYLIACPETGEALAIDPLVWKRCLDVASRRAGRSPRCSTRTSTAITPAAMTAWSARPARRCWRTPGQPAASAAWIAA